MGGSAWKVGGSGGKWEDRERCLVEQLEVVKRKPVHHKEDGGGVDVGRC